jgi:hypothetical protein
MTRNLTWVYSAAEMDTHDSEWQLHCDGVDTLIAIQDSRDYAGGLWTVAEHGYDKPGDESTFWLRHVEPGFRSLAKAKAKAVKIFEARTP